MPSVILPRGSCPCLRWYCTTSFIKLLFIIPFVIDELIDSTKILVLFWQVLAM